MSVTDRDLGFRALMRRFADANVSAVTVGVHSDEGEDAAEGGGDLTVLDVVTFHEFGTKSEEGEEIIPERSFIRAGVDQNEKAIKSLLKNVTRAVISNRKRMSPRRALEIVGADITRKIQGRIRDGIAPPLAAATLARKGGKTTPLIDTGQLIQSITFQVR